MWTRGGVVVGLVALVGGVIGGSAASGQDAEATVSVDQAHPAEDGVHYFVRLESADGEGVGGATVTATPTGPDGTEGEPTTLTAAGEDGLYEGMVELPGEGTWTILFASDDPEASLEHTQEMPADEAAVATDEESGDASDEANEPEEESSAAAEDDDDPSPVVPLVFAGVFAAALVALGIWVLLDRRRMAPAVAGDAPTETPAGPAVPAGAPAPEAQADAPAAPPTADTPPADPPAEDPEGPAAPD